MTNEQQQVKQWMKAFGQETPEKPVIPSLEIRKLRAKLIWEEALETITALNIGVYVLNQDDEYDCIQDLKDDITFTEWDNPLNINKINLAEIADGCEDLKVVTEGTLIACGLLSPIAPHDPLFDEVMRSNKTKLWQTAEVKRIPPYNRFDIKELLPNIHLVKDESGKVIKSPSYSPANLQPIIEEMSK